MLTMSNFKVQSSCLPIHVLPASEEHRIIGGSIFSSWDVKGSGVISRILFISYCGHELKVAEGLSRILFPSGECNADDFITCERVITIVRTLLDGSALERLRILIAFVNDNGDGNISYDEVASRFPMSDQQTMIKLGFLSRDGSKLNQSVAELLLMFDENSRGEEAIQLFCAHMMNLFTKNCTIPANVSYTKKGTDERLIESNESTELIELPRVISEPAVSSWNISKPQLFMYTISFGQIVIWAVNYVIHATNGFHFWICIAKGFGLNLRILTIILFLTMARTLMSTLFKYSISKPFIPLGFSAELHAYVGFCSVGHTIGHVFAHLAYRLQFLHVLGPITAFCKSDSITGVLLLIIMLTIAFCALHRNYSSEHYKRFTQTHFYLAWLVLNFLHVPALWPWYLAVGCLFILERAYDFFMKAICVTMVDCRPCPNGVVCIRCPKHGLDTPSGSYFLIKIPAISSMEWHAFSFAGSSSSSNCLLFYIDSVGDWTKELYLIVSDPDRRNNCKMYVQGPFLAPTSVASRNFDQNIIAVAGGIGITPFFGLMSNRVYDQHTKECDDMIFQRLFAEEAVNEKETVGLYSPLSPSKSRSHSFNSISRSHKYNSSRRKSYAALPSIAASTLSSRRISSTSESPGWKNAKPIRIPEPVRRDSLVPLKIPVDIESLVTPKRNSVMPLPHETNDDLELVSGGKNASIKRSGMVEIVWSIRDLLACQMYILYVAELLKLQKYQKNTVNVDLYITGLGSSNDPSNLISQVFLLLVICADGDTDHLTINFGRPNFNKILDRVDPQEVHFCGGLPLKNGISNVCSKRNIPFYSEGFGATCTVADQFYKKMSSICETIMNLFLVSECD